MIGGHTPAHQAALDHYQTDATALMETMSPEERMGAVLMTLELVYDCMMSAHQYVVAANVKFAMAALVPLSADASEGAFEAVQALGQRLEAEWIAAWREAGK